MNDGKLKLNNRTLLAITTVICLLSSSTLTLAAKRDPLNPTPIPRLKPSPLPDFAVLNVGNKHSHGVKGQFRYGGCINDFQVTAKNRGASYQYGDLLKHPKYGSKVEGGQVLVRLQLLEGTEVKWSHNQFFNSWGKNEIKNIYYSDRFPAKTNYVLKANIFACKTGSSTTQCSTFPEKKYSNNKFSVSYFISKACK